MTSPDVIDDMSAHILKLVGEGVPVMTACLRAEAAMREVWGGDCPYIKKGATDETMSDRDHTIVADYNRGERIDLLARRYGLSIRRVRQILNK